jgi:hypothetical protein
VKPEDDVRARARGFGGNGNVLKSATALTMSVIESNLISVRVTYND